MGRFLVVLFSLISSAAFAAIPGNAPILTIAAPGQNTQALSIPLSSLSGTGVNKVFSIYANTGSSTIGSYYPFYRDGTAYQVGASVSALCMNITADSSSASAQFQLMSATASFSNGASSVTGGVFQCGASGSTGCVSTGPTADVPGIVPGTFKFGSSTYPGFSTNNSALAYKIHLECYEQ